ncbi:MAG: hypothetical protein HY397_01845 [Candidatus Doudnabacteria bacterium]|nr:hypothetical protein [Candidatus Doudnabacteria bacterium]
MKVKAAAYSNLPAALIAVLDHPEFGSRIVTEVIVGKLHVPPGSLGPATHYVQCTDPLVPLFLDHGLVVGFTMLSATRTRSAQDFENAMFALEGIYEEALRGLTPMGMRTQLFVALSLDDKIDPPAHMGQKSTNLIETVPRWIEGKAHLLEELEKPWYEPTAIGITARHWLDVSRPRVQA